MDKTSSIFNNPMDSKTIKAAEKSKAKFIKKYGDDSDKDYKISFKHAGAGVGICQQDA